MREPLRLQPHISKTNPHRAASSHARTQRVKLSDHYYVCEREREKELGRMFLFPSPSVSFCSSTIWSWRGSEGQLESPTVTCVQIPPQNTLLLDITWRWKNTLISRVLVYGSLFLPWNKNIAHFYPPIQTFFSSYLSSDFFCQNCEFISHSSAAFSYIFIYKLISRNSDFLYRITNLYLTIWFILQFRCFFLKFASLYLTIQTFFSKLWVYIS